MENYMPIERKNCWFRMAGISKRIKDLYPPPHWRFEVFGEVDQHWINDFRLLGQATDGNNQPGTNPQAKGEELLAWIAYFGNVEVNEKGMAVVTLLTPTSSCPWS
jgi:hypothetical protein